MGRYFARYGCDDEQEQLIESIYYPEIEHHYYDDECDYSDRGDCYCDWDEDEDCSWEEEYERAWEEAGGYIEVKGEDC